MHQISQKEIHYAPDQQIDIIIEVHSANGNGNNGNGNGNGNNGNGNGNNGNNGNGGSNGGGGERNIYLKGSGSSFNPAGWQNIFNMADYFDNAETVAGSTPNVWHLVYTGNDFALVTYMQLTFINGEVFEWTPGMGPSVNGGGNNPGWVVVAPYDWQIAYVNSGNNNESGSFLTTTDTRNVNFNVSGFRRGTPPPPPPPLPEGEFTLTKTVDGVKWNAWASGYPGNISDLMADITLTLYRAGVAEPIATGTLNADGTIAFTWEVDDTLDFTKLPTGEYYIVENLGPLASQVFASAGPLHFAIGTSGEVVTVTDFDYNARYRIRHGYHDNNELLNYPGLTGGGNLFYKGVVNMETGQEYEAFCAYPHSRSFAGESGLGCEGYLVASRVGEELIDFDRFVSAYNYIRDNYGELSVRTIMRITQVVTWALLGAIDVYSQAFENTNLTDAEKAAVRDIIANSEGYAGEGNIVDLVYLYCELDHDPEDCQPLLVPVYGSSEPVLDNKTLPGENGNNSRKCKCGRYKYTGN